MSVTHSDKVQFGDHYIRENAVGGMFYRQCPAKAVQGRFARYICTFIRLAASAKAL
jgi:hypothetical protein